MQYIYYEKVHPTGSQLTSSRPLMRNWTEEEAKKRDNMEYKDGRGTGLVSFLLLMYYYLHHFMWTYIITSCAFLLD
jgi:hypothetical protein